MLEAVRIVAFIFSIVLHEVAHGYVAKKFGDHTADHAGRLTLNPIPHIDLVGSILVPLVTSQAGFTFGWAKPVPVNPLNFRDIRKGEFWVSAAGPLTNLGLALIAGLLFKVAPAQYSVIFLNIVFINVALATLNILPIPPLDGSKMLMSYLPYNLLRSYEKITPFGFILILLLSYLGIISPIIGGAIKLVLGLLGI